MKLFFKIFIGLFLIFMLPKRFIVAQETIDNDVSSYNATEDDENEFEDEDEEYEDEFEDEGEYEEIADEEPEEVLASEEKEIAAAPVEEVTAKEEVIEKKDEVKPTQKVEKSSPLIIEEGHEEESFADTVIFNFKNAKLQSLIDWISQIHDVTFIPDDLIKGGMKASEMSIANHFITFSTNKPLKKEESWNLFITFLDLAGLSVIPGPNKEFYRIIPAKTAITAVLPTFIGAVLPTFIGVEPDQLPNNDMKIRYVYFLQNTTPEQLDPLFKTFKLGSLQFFKELKALIFADKSLKIKSVMKIIKEFDKSSRPEVLKIIQLQKADVTEVIELYNKLAQKEEPQRGYDIRPKKESTLFYFPKDVNLFEDQRTNSLIILGPQDAIDRVEKFVKEFIDQDLEAPHSPLHKIALSYTDAKKLSEILKHITAFSKDSSAAKFGGVRGGEKYFKPMFFASEESSNSILINCDHEDFPHIEEVIKKLDVRQQQVALEVLILNVSSTKNKQIGMHLRNKDNQLISNNINFQTSGMPKDTLGKATSLVVDKDKGLLANLINLATGQVSGTTMISFGSQFNIWGLLKFLETYARTQVVANPFLITTNKYTASVSTGETRRVVTSTIQGATTDGDTKGDLSANLTVEITPRISEDRYGVINLKIDIESKEFTGEEDSSGDNERTTKRIVTNANVANREILALGGLMRDKEGESEVSTPLLGKIPLVGWIFKSKTKTREKESLLIFISPKIIEPASIEVQEYTYKKSQEARSFSKQISQYSPSEKRDPIYQWFFKDDQKKSSQQFMDDFLVKQESERLKQEDEQQIMKKNNKTNDSIGGLVKSRSLTNFMSDIPVKGNV